jgi:flagellar biosynthesis protein FlhA
VAEAQTAAIASGFERLGDFVRKHSDWVLGVGVLGLMVTLVTPVPAPLLDLLLALNITTAVLLLMITMNARDAIELSIFPTILLFTTLFRLGLNVASTRRILMGGDAGRIITAFGEYVGGSNLAVGLVVFLILIVIQFVVITKGSGRVSEVAARFVLDAMPGKQMAIDADLNGGLIDAEEAKRRRSSIASEAEFYGAMDGASKFVRGDAIAGLIITALNLVGGIAIALSNGQTLAAAGDRYSKLTIGDGLVSQIPALFISTAAGVLVTKGKSSNSLGTNLSLQLSGRPKATLIAAGMMFAIGLLPSMPKLPFLILALVLLTWWKTSQESESRSEALRLESETQGKAETGAEGEEVESDKVDELLAVDRICLEIGYRLIPLVQDKVGGGILEHVSQLRRRFALLEGIVLPPVRIKDNIKLAPNAYRILLGGQEISSGEIEPGEFMAMDGGMTSGKPRGRETTDPAFGLPAWWVAEDQRDEAELLGYTVIDPTSVLVTHLSETLRKALGELLTRDDVKELVEAAKKISPAVVEELVPDRMGYGEIQKVLRNLLREGVAVRNVPAILEALADNVEKTKDADALSELVRQRLGRAICERHGDKDGVVHAVTLDPRVESRLSAAVTGSQDTDASMVGPAYLQELMERIASSVAMESQVGKEVVLLVRSNVRRFLNDLAQTSLPKTAVLSYNEVVHASAVQTVDVVMMED